MAEPFLGEIKMFAGNFAPKGYALCDGQLLPISQNTALFSLLGTFYGGNGTSNFQLPDLRGRVSMHQGTGIGLTPRTLGEKFGEEAVAILSVQMPAHRHAQQASTNTAGAAYGPNASPAASSATFFYGSGPPNVPMATSAVTNTGGGQAHDNMAPFVAMTFIIALQGVFPSRN